MWRMLTMAIVAFVGGSAEAKDSLLKEYGYAGLELIREEVFPKQMAPMRALGPAMIYRGMRDDLRDGKDPQRKIQARAAGSELGAMAGAALAAPLVALGCASVVLCGPAVLVGALIVYDASTATGMVVADIQENSGIDYIGRWAAEDDPSCRTPITVGRDTLNVPGMIGFMGGANGLSCRGVPIRPVDYPKVWRGGVECTGVGVTPIEYRLAYQDASKLPNAKPGATYLQVGFCGPTGSCEWRVHTKCR